MSTEEPIQRYEIVQNPGSYGVYIGLEPTKEGEYVLFLDHQKALAELMRDEWKDGPLPEDAEIEAAHPLNTDNFKLHSEAIRLVSKRHGKWQLIDLVNWIMCERDKAQSELAEVAAERDRLKAELDRFKKRAQDLAIRMSL